MFKITDFVEFDSNNRATCPACTLSKGTGYRAKNLSYGIDGKITWYKCFRGCTKEEIREALGQPKDRLTPPPAPPPKNVTITPQMVKENTQSLMKSKQPLEWLLARGFTKDDISNYRIGLTRSKCGKDFNGKDIFLPSITIPIRADADGTRYYQKKRVAPWLEEDEQPDGYKAWSQYGIPPMVYFTHKPPNATETWLCEGEWDAMKMGLTIKESDKSESIAVACFTCGAGNVPPQEQLDRLPGNVVIWYDLDDAGDKGAIKVRDKMRDRAFIATVPAPGLVVEGWDISDALKQATLSKFTTAAATAAPWTEPKKENLLRSRLQTNDEMMASAQDFVEWLVPDILTQDELFILGMPPRGGKSLFCLTLAKAVATGGTFLDRPVTQGSVLYINMEDAATKVKQRQIAQGWSDGLPVYWMDKFKMSELPDLQELTDDIPDLRLVVLDTFSRIRDDGQKESSAELGKVLEPLQEWAKDRGICVLITHHTGKTNTDHPSADPFDALRGSTSIRATCRGALVIVPGESSYRLLAENGYSDRVDVSVRINPETLEWRLLGNWTPRIDGDMKSQILDHLNLVGEATVTEIASELSFNAASVSTIMSRLHRDSLVEKKGGKGRTAATYTRSSNLLKQLEAQFEHPNPDTATDTDLLKQNNLYGNLEGKVIIDAESDHSSDHPPSEGDHWLEGNSINASGHFVSFMNIKPETQQAQALGSIDHFPADHPTHTYVFEQSYNVDGDKVPCSNSDFQSLSKAKQGISIDSDVRFKGNSQSLIGRHCGKTVMKVLSLHDSPDGKTYATVAAMDWTQTQTVAVKDLKLV